MSGWAKGDLALCVNSVGWAFDGFPDPEEGGIYQVTHVAEDIITSGLFFGEIQLSLWFDGLSPEGYAAMQFRKIKPDTEGANEDDAAWLKDLLTKKVTA